MASPISSLGHPSKDRKQVTTMIVVLGITKLKFLYQQCYFKCIDSKYSSPSQYSVALRHETDCRSQEASIQAAGLASAAVAAHTWSQHCSTQGRWTSFAHTQGGGDGCDGGNKKNKHFNYHIQSNKMN